MNHMIKIGEKLNSSIPRIKDAIEKYNEDFVMQTAKMQTDAGADYLDVNTGVFVSEEPERLVWLINTVRKATKTRLMIDSPSAKALEAGLKADTIGGSILNSITLEKKRFDSIVPLVLEYKTGIVALPIDENGIPGTSDGRFENAKRLISALHDKGIEDDRIFIDALAEGVATESTAARATIETIRLIRQEYPDVHIVCGLSNVSFGLPDRTLINSAFMSAAVYNGLDAAIYDVANKTLEGVLMASNVIAGNDEYCLDFISYSRDKKEAAGN